MEKTCKTVEKTDASLWTQILVDLIIHVLNCFLIDPWASSYRCQQAFQSSLIGQQWKTQEEAEEQVQVSLWTL